MTNFSPTRPSTWDQDVAICLSEAEDASWQLGAPNVPIYQTSIITFPTLQALFDGQATEDETFVYQRGTNPTVQVLERKMAALERGERAKCFASGMGAISTVLSHLTSAGAHVVFVGTIYGPTRAYADYLGKFGVSSTAVDGRDLAAVEAAIQPESSVLYIESPASTSFEVCDVAAIAALAKSRGLTTVIDNTWATPLFFKPLTHGVDVVLHSLSKYCGGHSDLVGGVVIGSKEFIRDLGLTTYMLTGASMSPSTASLVLRGLRTLPVRLEEHQRNAFAMAAWLEADDRVQAVNFPGLPAHPDHALAARQLGGFGSLMSFDLPLKSDEDAHRFINSLEHFKIAISWGGFESLVSASRIAEAGQVGVLRRIRIFVGLEGAGVLISDLESAMAKVLPRS